MLKKNTIRYLNIILLLRCNKTKILQELQVKIEKATEELESLINIRDVKNSEYDRGLKDIDEQLVKINRVDSRIQFSIKTVDKSCNDPEKRNTLALIKV